MKLESPLDKLLRRSRIKIALPHIKSDMDICDVGCGENPVLLKYIAEKYGGKLIGIDKATSNDIHEKIEMRAANIYSFLPTDDQEFDLITMLAVLEHLDDYQSIIKECFRSLKPGGKLLLTTPSPASQPILELLANLRIISYQAIKDHKKYFKKEEIASLLQQHDFTDIKIWQVACGLNTVAVGTKKAI